MTVGGGGCAICSPGQSCFTQDDCFDGDPSYLASRWARSGDDMPRCVEGVPWTSPDYSSAQLRDACGGHYHYCSSTGVLWCYNSRWYTRGYCSSYQAD